MPDYVHAFDVSTGNLITGSLCLCILLIPDSAPCPTTLDFDVTWVGIMFYAFKALLESSQVPTMPCEVLVRSIVSPV